MKIEPFLEDCRERGVHLFLKEGELGYRAQKGAMTQDVLASIKENKEDILHHLKLTDPSRLQFKMLSSLKGRALLPNRFLWKEYSKGIMETTTANVTYSIIRQKGEFYADALEKAVSALLNRHEVLNCAIEKIDGALYLVDRPKQAPSFKEIVVKGETIEQREKEAIAIANELIWKEYNLEEDSLYRIFLIRISPNDFIFGAGLHHAIGDMISIGIFLNEILAFYYAVITSTPPKLLPVKYRYIDYLASLESWATSPGGVEHLNYWKELLRSTPVTSLLSDEHPSVNRSSGGESAEEIIELDSNVTSGINKLAADLKKTLFCVLLAAYKIAIWRMTGQEDPVVISLQTGRLNAGLMNVVGDFAMEIAYKTDLSGNPDFSEIADRVMKTMNEAQSHQPVPLDWVRKALFDEGISFNAPGMSILTVSGDEPPEHSNINKVRIQPPGVRHGCHGFPVSCAVEFRESPNSIVGSMIYRTDVYDELTIQKFLDYFKEVVIDVVKDPKKKLYDFMGSDKKEA